ncbi:MAG TPA: hypothetical protein VNB24_07600 [Acidimicrobiales bacterium]|nr:hypothetical protein [Acidimicrobiales bacterium]
MRTPSKRNTAIELASDMCLALSDQLATYAEGVDAAPADVRAHIDSCLRCQAEMVQYRRLLRGLHTLRTEVLEPAPGTLTGILAHIEHAGERRAVRSLLQGRRGAYLGGIAVAATAAGAAGALVLAGRARRRALNIAS